MHYATEVFTPSVPAKLSFIERESLNAKLVSALKTPGKQIVIFGHSGAGKSTLLQNKLFQTYERHITTRCMKGMAFEEVLRNSFDQLEPFYLSEKSKSSDKSKTSTVGTGKYFAIQSAMEAKSSQSEGEKQSRMLPPQLTPQTLAKLVGDVKACWVLEDFHKLEVPEKTRLAQTMKIFMDMAMEYPDLKTIAIGATNSAREVVQYDREMNVRVAEIEVPLMADKELEQIIEKGQNLLNIKFPTSVRAKIVQYSNGLPSVCHQLCLNSCIAANIEKTQSLRTNITPTHLEEALRLYVEGTSDTLKNKFDRAIRTERKRKYDNCELILKSLTEFDQDGAIPNEIHLHIKKNHPTYPAGNLNNYLDELKSEHRGEVIRIDIASGRYSFSDPFLRAYALVYFKRKAEKQSTKVLLSGDDLMDLLLESLGDGKSFKIEMKQSQLKGPTAKR